MKYVFFAVLSMLCAQVLAQTTDLPKIIPTSPNASALGKFGDIPVSVYSGTVNFSVPIYEIKSGSISIPVSLNYHTGGIRLNDMAGWTGLGWVLQGGGIISRNILNKDDFDNMAYNLLPEIITKDQISPALAVFDGIHDVRPINLVSTTGTVFDFNNYAADLNAYDTEFDIFSYNYLGRSGRFIITKAGKVILEKQDDIKITFVMEDGFPTFSITDENGFIYSFKDQEFTTHEDPIGSSVTSWYLTKVTSPKNDMVNFVYQRTSKPRLDQIQQFQIFQCGESTGELSTVSTSFSFEDILILDSITFDNGYMKFLNDDLRSDYPGKRINGVEVYSTFSSLPIKKFDFSYSYFNNDVTLPGQFKRLKLEKVTEMGNNNIAIPPYEFKYIEPTYQTQLTQINSFSIDHWGYFNGVANTNIMPSFTGSISAGGLTELYLDLPGANRESNQNTASVFSLKEIKYPSGGKTVLDLESNTFDNFTVTNPNPSVEHLTKTIYMLTSDGTGTQSGTLDFSKALGDVKVTIGFLCSNPNCDSLRRSYKYPLESIYFEINGERRDFEGDFTTCGGVVCTVPSLILSRGIMNWTAHMNSNVSNVYFQRISALFEWTENVFPENNDDRFQYAGGLRVKQMTEYDADNKFIKSKKYDYHYSADNNNDNIPETYTYGKLMASPSYTHYKLEVAEGGSVITPGLQRFCTPFERLSSSLTPLSTIVGYDKVTEYVVDAYDVAKNGKTEYSYFNDRDSTYTYSIPPDHFNGVLYGKENVRPPGMLNFTHQGNGLLKSRVDYQKSSSLGKYFPVMEETNEYWHANLNNYFSLKHEAFSGVWSNGTYLLYVYPAIRSERILLKSTTEKIYNAVIPNSYVEGALPAARTTLTTYDYNSKHVQVTQQTRKDSKGKIHIDKKIYPFDYGNGGIINEPDYGINNLIQKNILAAPIEQYSIIQDNDQADQFVTGGSITTFKPTLPFPDQVYVLETLKPIPLASFNASNSILYKFDKDPKYKLRLTFQNYDSRGNILSVSKSKDINISYLWGYNNAYPVAEIKNASSDQVFYTSFEEVTSNSSSTAKTGSKGYTAAYTVVLPAAGTYNLTYWKKIGTGAWQFTSSVVSANTTIGGGGAIIDEVRLYPPGALMSTFIYQPGIGLISGMDSNNQMTTYQYDGLGRLEAVKDDIGNILKTYIYHYK